MVLIWLLFIHMYANTNHACESAICFEMPGSKPHLIWNKQTAVTRELESPFVLAVGSYLVLTSGDKKSASQTTATYHYNKFSMSKKKDVAALSKALSKALIHHPDTYSLKYYMNKAIYKARDSTGASCEFKSICQSPMCLEVIDAQPFLMYNAKIIEPIECGTTIANPFPIQKGSFLTLERYHDETYHYKSEIDVDATESFSRSLEYNSRSNPAAFELVYYANSQAKDDKKASCHFKSVYGCPHDSVICLKMVGDQQFLVYSEHLTKYSNIKIKSIASKGHKVDNPLMLEPGSQLQLYKVLQTLSTKDKEEKKIAQYEWKKSVNAVDFNGYLQRISQSFPVSFELRYKVKRKSKSKEMKRWLAGTFKTILGADGPTVSLSKEMKMLFLRWGGLMAGTDCPESGSYPRESVGYNYETGVRGVSISENGRVMREGPCLEVTFYTKRKRNILVQNGERMSWKWSQLMDSTDLKGIGERISAAFVKFNHGIRLEMLHSYTSSGVSYGSSYRNEDCWCLVKASYSSAGIGYEDEYYEGEEYVGELLHRLERVREKITYLRESKHN
eukprot:90552_1